MNDERNDETKSAQDFEKLQKGFMPSTINLGRQRFFPQKK